MESLNDLILMASTILDNGFDLQTFLEWKRVAFALLLGALGPSHYYTLNFGRFTEASRVGLLAGRGLLEATKEQLGIKSGQDSGRAHTAPENGCPPVPPLALSSRRNS